MSSTDGPWPSAACTASVGRKLLADPNTLALLPTRRQCSGPRVGLDSRLKGQVSTAFAILNRAGSCYAPEPTSSSHTASPQSLGTPMGGLNLLSLPLETLGQRFQRGSQPPTSPPLSHEPLPTGSLAVMAMFLGVFSQSCSPVSRN